MRQAWYEVEMQAARLWVWLVATLPLSVSLGLARWLGRIIFFVWRRRRRVAIDNLLTTGMATDERVAKRMGCATFESFVVMVVETIIARERLSVENWAESVKLLVTPEAEALLREKGRGLIVASAHLGNWEVAARAVSQIKPMCVVYRPVKNPKLNAFLHSGRSGEHLKYMSRLESDPKRFLIALSTGEMVALMVDQHVGDGRVKVDFMGRPTWTSKAVAMLHFTTRAPLLVAVAVRTGALQYEVHAVGPIRGERTGDRERDVTALMQRVSDEVEALIRRYPEQYMWGHRRWKVE